MYMGMEIQRNGDGTMVNGSYTSVNNIYLQGLRIAAMVPTGEVTYYLTDQVDSVRLVADEQGQPVTRTEYYPYGDAWFQEGNTHHAPKYNSQELDRESGLYFYNARYYDAGVGRFVTADNVIDGEFDTQGWNRYAYVKGNPIKFSDPSGHNPAIVVVGYLIVITIDVLTTPREMGGNKKNDKGVTVKHGDTDKQYGKKLVTKLSTDLVAGTTARLAVGSIAGKAKAWNALRATPSRSRMSPFPMGGAESYRIRQVENVNRFLSKPIEKALDKANSKLLETITPNKYLFNKKNKKINE